MHNSTLARHGWPARVFARHVWRSFRRGHTKPRPRHFALTRHVALLVGAAMSSACCAVHMTAGRETHD
jgi:hypothetical protein